MVHPSPVVSLAPLYDGGQCVLQDEAKAKFNESVEIAINLGIDPRRGDQQVRGAVVLPHGTGTNTRVAVFAEDEAAELARSAGECSCLWSVHVCLLHGPFWSLEMTYYYRPE